MMTQEHLKTVAYLLNYFRDQILKNKPERALKVMSNLSNFHGAFVNFVQDEAYKEGQNILQEKDIQRKEFNMDCLKNFSYNEQLGKGSLSIRTNLIPNQDLQSQSPISIIIITNLIRM